MENNDTLEIIQRILLDKLRPYPDHPFRVRDDDMMQQTVESIGSEQATPSFSQARRMRRLSGEGKLNDDAILGIMLEQKKPENWNLTLPMEKIRKCFPRSYTPQRMEETIGKQQKQKKSS